MGSQMELDARDLAPLNLVFSADTFTDEQTIYFCTRNNPRPSPLCILSWGATASRPTLTDFASKTFIVGVQWNMLGDIVRFADGRQDRVKNWLKAGKLPDRLYGCALTLWYRSVLTLLDFQSRTFHQHSVWQMSPLSAPYFDQLWSSPEASNPLAHLQLATNLPPTPMILMFEYGANEAFMTEVLLAVTILEQRMRTSERVMGAQSVRTGAMQLRTLKL